jgi:hypothetical protein
MKNNSDIKVGDYVICVEENLMTGGMQLKNGERYKVIEIDKLCYVVEDNNYECEIFLKSRFVSEIEYDTKNIIYNMSAMLRKSGLKKIQKFKSFINKQGGDISKNLKDKTVSNTLDNKIYTLREGYIYEVPESDFY